MTVSMISARFFSCTVLQYARKDLSHTADSIGVICHLSHKLQVFIRRFFGISVFHQLRSHAVHADLVHLVHGDEHFFNVLLREAAVNGHGPQDLPVVDTDLKLVVGADLL